MKKHSRYFVLKIKDVKACLSNKDQLELQRLMLTVDNYRLEHSKRPLKCVVVESDWPEYEPTWEAIQKRVDSNL